MEISRCSVGKVCSVVNVKQNLHKPFLNPGVEKNNDDAKRHYFSSNLHDTVGEVLKAEGRLDETSKFKRTKRKYTRKTTGANKQPRLDQDS